MIFSLSADIIADIIHAHAALELLSADPGGEGRRLLTPLLDRERHEPLDNLVRNAFAETVVDLLPYVTDVSLPESEGALLAVDLRLPASFSPTLVTVLRRRIEHLIAMRVLDSAIAASAVTLPGLSAVFAERHREARASVLASLRGVPEPFVRSRFC